MNTPETPNQIQDRWQYKIAIYSCSNIAASVALVHYKTYRIGLTMPLCKTAIDRLANKAITMYYFKQADEAYAMWEVLKFVGMTWNHDAYLYHYDWNENKLTPLQTQSHHHHDRECDA